MRIAIDHRTRYRFSEPQARIVQMLRLTPTDTTDQTVVSWLLGVDCDATLRDAVDGFGNAVTMLYADGPIEAIEVTVTGEVLTTEAGGVVRGGFEPLPPLVFLRDTVRTAPAATLAAFAQDSVSGTEEPLERLHRLTAAFHTRYPDATDAADTGATAAEAFEGRTATSRDVAQMFVTAARTLEIPARYVSGYRSDGVAHSAPHGWAEAYVEKLGWIGFDPVRGLSPDDSYVRVAVGLDAPTAAAIVGMRIGAGDEKLDVDLQATAEG